MPALLLTLVLLLVGCAPGPAPGGIPTADEPFTLVALDVGQPTFRDRCIGSYPELMALLFAGPAVRTIVGDGRAAGRRKVAPSAGLRPSAA